MGAEEGLGQKKRLLAALDLGIGRGAGGRALGMVLASLWDGWHQSLKDSKRRYRLGVRRNEFICGNAEFVRDMFFGPLNMDLHFRKERQAGENLVLNHVELAGSSKGNK